MVDQRSGIPLALTTFIQECGRPIQLPKTVKETVQEAVDRASKEITDSIRPGRYLVTKTGQNNRNGTEETLPDKNRHSAHNGENDLEIQELKLNKSLDESGNLPKIHVAPALVMRQSKHRLPYFPHHQLDPTYFPQPVGAPTAYGRFVGPIYENTLLPPWSDESDSESNIDDNIQLPPAVKKYLIQIQKAAEQEESSEDDSSDTDGCNETYVKVNGRPIAIWRYLGKDWTADIRTLVNIPAKEQPPYCLTELRPWQLSGSSKLRWLTTTRFRGGMLGDEQGTGKTLTTLDVMMNDIYGNNKDIYNGFNLIVSTKSSIPQWVDEIKEHFGKDIAERTMVLDDPTISANELLDRRPFFVICTYGFLENRWRAFRQTKKFYTVVSKLSLEKTLEGLRNSDKPDMSSRHVNSLFSPVYRLLRKPIRHLVLDEAHKAKNRESNTYKAIRDLRYDCILLLSGTFLANKWYDVFGLISLLPGHPFTTWKLFMRAFAEKKAGGGYSEPTASKRNRLVKFLQAFTISRPASVMELKGMIKVNHEFDLTLPDESMVAYYVEKFLKAMRIRGRRKVYVGDLSTNDSKALAMVNVIRAMQYCANPNLMQTRSLAVEDELGAKGRHILEEHKAKVAKLIGDTPGMNAILKSITTQLMGDIDSVDNKALVDEDDEDEADAEYLLDNDTPEELSDVEENTPPDAAEPKNEHQLSYQSKQARAAWLQKVKDLSDDALFSPKVVAALDLLVHIYDTWPNEKVVIFSKMLMFLDILEEAILRRPNVFKEKKTPLRFHGNLSDPARREVKEQFSEPRRNDPLLITAGAGGTSINLQAGSQIIQCEPWWNATDEQQAYFRCWRYKQQKEVHIWVLRARNSLIDVLMEETRDKKTVTNMAIMHPLRRKDEEEIEIPYQYREAIGE